ncbi:MAG: metallophosphoesterase [Verrucomicrobiota bacterium]
MRKNASQNFDIIGDIHGHCDELERLLGAMGYEFNDGCYRHPEGRKVIFVGDLIDRGPKIRETLALVKAMHDRGEALVTLGNHEYNAVCFCTNGPTGDPLREHSDKNCLQLLETSRAFMDHVDEWEDYLNWFKTLPFFLDLGDFRVVHACWSQRHIDLLGGKALHDDEFLQQTATPGTAEYWAVETVLKGAEIKLPDGVSFADKAGHVRTKTRVKWWHQIENLTYRSASYPEQSDLPEESVSSSAITEPWDVYGSTEVPVFCGHYWLPPEKPTTEKNVVCLDYSVALDGFVAAYRWEQGSKLSDKQFFTSNNHTA